MLDISHLKSSRLRLGLTQTQFAKQAGISQSLITKIEAGKIDPKYSTVKRIEEALARLEHGNEHAISEVMHRGIVSATLREPLPHLVKRMRSGGISQVPVLDGKHVAGLVTEQDILEAIALGKPLAELVAEDVMQDAPPILPANTPLSTAIHIVEHIPLVLVRKDKTLVGTVTRSDLLLASMRSR